MLSLRLGELDAYGLVSPSPTSFPLTPARTTFWNENKDIYEQISLPFFILSGSEHFTLKKVGEFL